MLGLSKKLLAEANDFAAGLIVAAVAAATRFAAFTIDGGAVVARTIDFFVAILQYLVAVARILLFLAFGFDLILKTIECKTPPQESEYIGVGNIVFVIVIATVVLGVIWCVYFILRRLQNSTTTALTHTVVAEHFVVVAAKITTMAFQKMLLLLK